MKTDPEKKIVVGISGASGSLYAIRLIRALALTRTRIYIVLTQGAETVMFHELGVKPGQAFLNVLAGYGVDPDGLEIFSQGEMEKGPASGSFVHDGMVVCPCSMKSLAALAAGFADNLLTRSADVCLKEKRTLVVVPRETPLNLIHLENMAALARAGAVILPPCPSFYSLPETVEDLVDTVVARILDHLGVGHDLAGRWGA